jgi:hypothetical protein
VNAIRKNKGKKTTATDLAVEAKRHEAEELLRGHGGKKARDLKSKRKW